MDGITPPFQPPKVQSNQYNSSTEPNQGFGASYYPSAADLFPSSEPTPEPQSEPLPTQSFDLIPEFSVPEMAPTQPAAQPVIAPEGVSSSEPVSYGDAQIEEIDVTKVVPNPYQPRKVFDPEALKELADSIREHGVIQPLVVTRTPNGYELVVGERRFRASVLAGLAKVPAIVKRALGDQTKLEVALIENIQRRELNPIEEAQAYERLIQAFNLTQEQVAKKVGKSRPSVTNTLRLLNLPAEIQRGVIEGKVSEGHARAILGVADTEKQLQLYKLVQEQNLNVRQVEAKVRELTMRKTLDAAAPDPKLIAIESELRGRLGTQVKIQKQGTGGRIMIEFFSEEELRDLVGKLGEHSETSGGGYLTV